MNLGLNRIIAMVLPENIGSIRVLEKVGMQHEKDISLEAKLVRQYAMEKQ